MDRKKKLLLIYCIIILILLILIGGSIYTLTQGILVKPDAEELAGLNNIQDKDIIEFQCQREIEIYSDYYSNHYTMKSPYVVTDPYKFNPLCAQVIFDADYSSDIRVVIEGKDIYSTIEYTKTINDTHYEIPIIGLYPDTHNKVHIYDNRGNCKDLTFLTPPLPDDFEVYEMVTSNPQLMGKGLTLASAYYENSYTALLDCYGDVRGYISNKQIAHGTSITLLENGRILSAGDEYKYLPNNMTNLYEYNWLGKVFKEYMIPNGISCNVKELDNGNLIAVSNRYDMFHHSTNNDTVIIIDRNTGEIIKEYDFNDILGNTKQASSFFMQNNFVYSPINDYLMITSAEYNNQNDSIIVASKKQSQLICIDAKTSEIKWIIGSSDNDEETSDFLSDYQLTPTGENFQWQRSQHQITILPDMDNNENTVEIILFDNGQNNSYSEEYTFTTENSYPRGVIYSIDERNMTVKQLWEYENMLETQCYNTILGYADYLPVTQNKIICYTSQDQTDNDEIESIASSNQIVSKIVEITNENEVVYEVTCTPSDNDYSANIYQAKRIPLYIDKAYNYYIGNIYGQRIGNELCDNLITNKKNAVPIYFTDSLSVNFNTLYQKDDRLIIDAVLSKSDDTSINNQINLALISQEDKFGFTTRQGLSGRILCSINLTQIPKGEYLISFYADVNCEDAPFIFRWMKGHCRTEYKVAIH